MSNPSVHVVVLNRNGRALLSDCFRSLFASDYPNLTVWLADNASADDSLAWTREAFPQVRIVETGGNLGWSGGNNAGIRKALEAGADYVWILNNDVEVAPDCISKQIELAEQPGGPAIVGPMIYYYDDRNAVWFEGGKIDFDSLRAEHCSRDVFQALPHAQRFITGCALMVHRSVFERIGLIDERLFIYWEDTDFCVRATRAGFAVGFVADAVMYHKVGAYSATDHAQQSPFQAYNLLRSEMLFWRKHLGEQGFRRRWCSGHLGKWVNAIPQDWALGGKDRERAEAIMDAVWYNLRRMDRPLDWPKCPYWFRFIMRHAPWRVVEWM